MLKFTAILLKDDPRTGFKKGWTQKIKGLYYQRKNIILVGNEETGDTIRLSFPKESIQIEINIFNHAKLVHKED